MSNYTKNPLIAKAFREMSLVEELGSGTRNIRNFAPLYYNNYEISIQNGQQFQFSMTYQRTENDTLEPNDDTKDINHDTKKENHDTKGINHDAKKENHDTKEMYFGSLCDVDKKAKAKRQQNIVRLIKTNNKLSQREMSELLDIPIATLKRDIEELQKNEVIDHIGGKKYGHWVLVREA